jgi:rhodanese-related sulfurtransferase
MERTRRRLLAGAAGATTAGLAGCLGVFGGGGSGGDDPNATWRTATLTDVRTGEEFAVADLPTPLLLETFAVWCSTCLRQQRELRALKDSREVESVTLNVDPNEDAAAVRDHLDEHGFDWRYAVAPPAVTDSLVSAFGASVTTPPRAPVIVVCESGARRLGDGVKSADRLASELDDGC